MQRKPIVYHHGNNERLLLIATYTPTTIKGKVLLPFHDKRHNVTLYLQCLRCLWLGYIIVWKMFPYMYACDPSRTILHVLHSTNALVSSIRPKGRLFKIAYCASFSAMIKKLVVSLSAYCVRGTGCSKSTFGIWVVSSGIKLIKISLKSIDCANCWKVGPHVSKILLQGRK
jgi:hypothetical protein